MPENPNLMLCPDCGSQISRRAAACPHCGCPIQASKVQKAQKVRDLSPKEGLFLQTLNCGCLVAFIIIGLIVYFAITSGAC